MASYSDCARPARFGFSHKKIIIDFLMSSTDGFTPFPSIMTYLPGVSDSDLPHHWDMEASLDKTCPTILMDFDSGIYISPYLSSNV